MKKQRKELHKKTEFEKKTEDEEQKKQDKSKRSARKHKRKAQENPGKPIEHLETQRPDAAPIVQRNPLQNEMRIRVLNGQDCPDTPDTTDPAHHNFAPVERPGEGTLEQVRNLAGAGMGLARHRAGNRGNHATQMQRRAAPTFLSV